MEEFDDLVPTPDEDGGLELSYRGWAQIDDVVWTMGRELVSLNVSFNAIESLPPELGDLHLLRELNIACNKLQTLPKQIGKLRQLRVLKINGNQIQSIPDDIGQCNHIERLYAGENRLPSFPATVENMKGLEILQLSNNDLTSIPPALCLIETIKEIDLGNNPGLQHMIPSKLQDNTEFILWMCDIWYNHQKEVVLINQCNEAYSNSISRGETKTKTLVNKVDRINTDTRDLLDEMPKGCLLKLAQCTASCKGSCSIM
mmetsp:Transcript_13571/g.31672  ORF Transcript_13571/g.31672 Transcript_13571/m.31672 type:complete len:258 (+) Transcript_13571:171-944(+)